MKVLKNTKLVHIPGFQSRDTILFKSSWDTMVLGHQWTCFNDVQRIVSPLTFFCKFGKSDLYRPRINL